MFINFKDMRKLMIEFLIKYTNRSIKITRVNSILITKSFNLELFTVRCWGPLWSKADSNAQSIYREVYGWDKFIKGKIYDLNELIVQQKGHFKFHYRKWSEGTAIAEPQCTHIKPMWHPEQASSTGRLAASGPNWCIFFLEPREVASWTETIW